MEVKHVLEARNLSKSYGSTLALDKICFELGQGIYGLLGPNGAGKSTLMNIITLGLDADDGEILWDGQEIGALGSKFRSILGFMPQQQPLYDSFSGFTFLNYIAALKAVPKKEIKNEILCAANQTNLTSRLPDRLSSYSGGMKQRILLAAAIIGNPQLLILDEPTAGLDPKERYRTRNLIQEISKNKIIIFATHVVSDIETIADEVILMKKGKILQKDKIKPLCEKYGDGNGLEGVYMHFFADEEELL